MFSYHELFTRLQTLRVLFVGIQFEFRPVYLLSPPNFVIFLSISTQSQNSRHRQ